MHRVLAVALGLIAAGVTSCAQQASARDGAPDDRLRGDLADAVVRRTRGGGRPAAIANGELGIIAAARMSPNGRWVALVDEIAPHIKIVNDSGVTTAVIDDRADSVTGAGNRPVIAVSNTAILILRNDTHGAELRDFGGKHKKSLGVMDFLPVTATAFNDSIWFVYGPSRKQHGGQSTWVHCLYVPGIGQPHWGDAFLDRVDSVSSAMANVAAPFVDDNAVWIEHRQQHGGLLLSVDCGSGMNPPIAAIRARSTGRAMGTRDAADREPRYQETSGVAGASLTKVGTRLWMIASDDAPSVVFESVGGRSAQRALRIPGDYRVMDSRASAGVLFANADRAPVLFELSRADLAAWLPGPTRAPGGAKDGAP